MKVEIYISFGRKVSICDAVHPSGVDSVYVRGHVMYGIGPIQCQPIGLALLVTGSFIIKLFSQFSVARWQICYLYIRIPLLILQRRHCQHLDSVSVCFSDGATDFVTNG